MKEEFAVQNEIIADKMYSKFNVEKDTYNAALVYHNLTNDPEV